MKPRRPPSRASVVLCALFVVACQKHEREVLRALPRTEQTEARAPQPEAARAAAEYEQERERMVKEQLMARDIRDPRVLHAMRVVPRHRFVPRAYARRAYADTPLPIPAEQTISQPYIVAFMSEAAQIKEGARCLEVGTGSGYQAAILTELCRETYSIEYLPEVAAFGRRNLEAMGYLSRGLSLRVGDGYAGWPEHAPFDAILVTAAPETVPPPLLAQLAMGGRLVIPVGGRYGQELEVWTRVAPGDTRRAFERKVLFGVMFVPFLGPQGD